MDHLSQKEQETQKLTTNLWSTKAEVLSLKDGLEKSTREIETLYQIKSALTQKEQEVRKLTMQLERNNQIIEEQKRDLEKNSNETTEVRREYEVYQALSNAAYPALFDAAYRAFRSRETYFFRSKSLWVPVNIKNKTDIELLEGFDMSLEFPNDIPTIESLICKTANKELTDYSYRRSTVRRKAKGDYDKFSSTGSLHSVPFTVCKLMSVDTDARERSNQKISLCVTLH